MEFTDDQIREMCARLVQGHIHYEALQVSLNEFRAFYESLYQLTGRLPRVSLVNLETLVKGQFSDVSPQHFDIQEQERLKEEDFDFVLEKTWYGTREETKSFGQFIWEELKRDWLKLLPVFAASGGLLYVINDLGFYELVGTFLVQSTTVFLSIYLIFTVSQSQNLRRDPSLFKDGTLHGYYRDDRNVTILGIITVGLTFLSSGIASLVYEFSSDLGYGWEVAAKALSAIATASVVTLLFETFFTVANYYLERERDIVERDISADILDKEYRSYLE
jgi:hypothetical protein